MDNFDFLNDKGLCFVKDREPCEVYLDGTKLNNLSAVEHTLSTTDSLSYYSEYNNNLKQLNVEGNTFQKTYTGKNLIDVDKFVEIVLPLNQFNAVVERDGRRCLRFYNSSMHGKNFTACCPTFKANTRYIISCDVLPDTPATTSNSLFMGFKPSPMKQIAANTTTEFTRLYVVSNASATVTDIAFSYGVATYWLIDLDTLYLYEYEGDDNPTYEPYTGRMSSPNAGKVIKNVEKETVTETIDLSNMEYVSDGNTYMLSSSEPIHIDGDFKLTCSNLYLNNEGDMVVIAQQQSDIFSGRNINVLAEYLSSSTATYDVQASGDFYIGIGNVNEGIPEGQEYTYWDTLRNSTIQIEYEKQIVSETIIPAYPQPIENASNIKLELRGVNLLDISSVVTDVAFKITNDTIVFTPKSSFLKYKYVVKVEIGKQYTISVGDVFNSVTTNASLNRLPVGNTANYDKSEYGFVTKNNPLTITATTEDLYIDGYACYTYYEGQIHTIVKPMVVEGTQVLPYQPYVEPKTITIPSEVTLADGTVLPLHMGEGDTLVVNGITKKVTYTSTFYQYTFTGDEATWKLRTELTTEGKSRFSNNTFLEPYGRNPKALSNISKVTMLGVVSDDSDYGLQLIITTATGTSKIVYFTLPTMTLAEFKQWLKDNPTTLRYEVKTPLEHDITDTELGQELLSLTSYKGTNVLTITGDNVSPTKLEITYADWGGKYED